MNDYKQILDMLEEEDRHLNGYEAISLLYRIKGFIKSMETEYVVGFANQERKIK
jgi:hypothetical protein